MLRSTHNVGHNSLGLPCARCFDDRSTFALRLSRTMNATVTHYQTFTASQSDTRHNVIRIVHHFSILQRRWCDNEAHTDDTNINREDRKSMQSYVVWFGSRRSDVVWSGPMLSDVVISQTGNRIWCILALRYDIRWQQFQWFSWESTDQVSTWREERYDPAYICRTISIQFVHGRKTGHFPSQ